jgi:hypothetical protein
MKYNFREIFFAVFSTFWISLLFLDYINKHPIYWLSIEHYKYLGLTIFWMILAIPFSLFYSRSWIFKKYTMPFINGLVLYGIILILLLSTVYAFNIYLQADLNISNYSHVITRSTYTLLCSYLVLLSAYTAGNLSLKFPLSNIKIGGITKFLVETAIGFLIIIMGLFFLGMMGLLTQWLVLGLLLIFPLINYKRSASFVLHTFWKRIEIPNTWNFWGLLVIFLTLIYSTINFLYTQAPFPLGFDARNYYVNISNLIAESGSLIKGFQPYAWSLLDSVGYIAFLSSEVTLFLATIGGFLTCFGIYELGTKYLKIDPNYCLLAALLFMSTPAVNNHWIVEFKIDLALLFIQFSILCLLFHWLTVKKTDGATLLNDKSDWAILIILSLLLGFSLSIKVLSIFLVFGIFLVFWWYSKDNIGLIGIASIGFSLVIFLKLDEISGLRVYHDNPNNTAWGLLILGSCLLIFSIIKDRLSFFRNLLALGVCSIIMILTFSPWLAKNYKEASNKKDVMTILLGESPQTPMDAGTIIQNYRKR